MKGLTSSALLLLAMGLLLLSGCGEKTSAPPASTVQTTPDGAESTTGEATPGDASANGSATGADMPKPANEVASLGTKPAEPEAKPPEAKPEPAKPAATAGKVPETPDAAVLAALSGLADDRPQTFWEFLPASYQKDINDLIHLSAEKTDEELYNETFATLQKGAGILKSKREFFLTMLSEKSPEFPREDLEKGWDQVVGLVETLVSSDLADLEKVKALDLGEFLSTTGSKLVKQTKGLVALAPVPVDPFAVVAGTEAKVISQEGDTAVVELSNPTEEEPKQVEFVKVEGKWIPQDLADGWAENIEQAKQAIAAAPEKNEEVKPMLLAALGGINESLDQLAAAETPEEFEAAGQQLLGSFIGAAMMFAPQGAGPDLGPGTSPDDSPKKPEAKDSDKPESKKDADKPEAKKEEGEAKKETKADDK